MHDVMKKKLFLLLMIWVPMIANAFHVTINNINYWLYPENSTAKVINSDYNGDIIIPDSINYAGIIYSITSIDDYAFYNCTNLTSIIIPNSVTQIGNYAFKNCSSLVSSSLGDGVNSLGDGSFQNCTSLTSITIPKSLTNIGYFVFQNCPVLTSIHISDLIAWCEIKSAGSIFSTFHRLYLNGNEINDLVVPDDVTTIGSEPFSFCESITSVTVPNSVTYIGSGAFSNCRQMSSLSLGYGVKSIGEYAFSYCTCLTSVTVPSSVTKIDYNAFQGCNSLTSVHISDLSAWCNINFGFGGNPLNYAHHLYLNGEEIKELVIPKDITAIGNFAFEGCSELTSVNIPDNIVAIYKSAFFGCTGLTSVSIPNSVTFIDNEVFYGCKSLTSISIPNSVTSIGESAFNDCESLTSVVSFIKEPFDIFGKSSYYKTFPIYVLDNATLYVPVGTIDKYKSTEGWKDFAHIVEGTGGADGISCLKPDDSQILISENTVTIQSKTNGTPICVYTANGTLVGSAIIQNGQAIIKTDLQSGTLAIVKIGEKNAKVMVK